MKNWNTNTNKMFGPTKRIWELTQLINYGLDGTKLSAHELKANWSELFPHLHPAKANMLQWLLWNRRSSPLSNTKS